MQTIHLLIPEIALLVLTCTVLIIDLFRDQNNKNLTYSITQLSLATVVGLCLWYWPNESREVFYDQFIVDSLSQFLKISILITLLIVLGYTRQYVEQKKFPYGEFHLLTLFSALGMMVLVSSQSFLVLYLGIELLSLPLYALVVINRTSGQSAEAGLKYFVMGALASGLLLYGISLVFGVTQSLNFLDISLNILNTSDLYSILILQFGILFILAGVAFKLGAVPFHMWVPDVYEGAPSAVTVIIATAPKIAVFGMMCRLFLEGFPLFYPLWQNVMVGLAVLSLALGNILAIAQTNLKRMLGYSTISHIGFLLLGFLAGEAGGFTPSLFYIMTYVLVTAGVFGIILALSNKHKEINEINDLAGLSRRHPWLSFLMLIMMFSLAGVPPTVGFYAKFLVLNALIKANLLWLAVLAMLFSIIGAFYYLRVVKVMYFDDEISETNSNNKLATFETKWILTINGLAALILGILPAPIYIICQTVLSRLA